MGAGASTQEMAFDADKFIQSKAIMDEAGDDSEKFDKLKKIWANAPPAGEGAAPGAPTGDGAAPPAEGEAAADANKKSTSALPPAEGAGAEAAAAGADANKKSTSALPPAEGEAPKKEDGEAAPAGDPAAPAPQDAGQETAAT